MKPRGLFFAQRKSPPKWVLQLSSFSIRCGAGCLPVSRRQSTDDSQCAKKTYQTGNAPPHRGIHHTKNLTSDETRFNALRRCDRGTDAMHLANTPVVSPESKKPRTMARLGVLIGQTQIRQPTLNILLICSLKCKHVVTLFCNFPHAFAIVKRILQRLVQAEERRVDNLLNFPADG